MSEKLLTLQELSDYLKINEEKVNELVRDGVISAYKIGGEILRFRIEQIDAIRAEIDERVQESDRIKVSDTRKNVKERMSSIRKGASSTFLDRVADFFYFNDFYLISALIIAALLFYIFKG
ncbi:MAG: helix-turn-helix domain-containing protein [Candidatus Omnitrophica bacterium]|jgi:excisionase family DNA binding protein|nr:helix-turn-helix domain-containing protein [Candidatus Omnitrophota bacterium]